MVNDLFPMWRSFGMGYIRQIYLALSTFTKFDAPHFQM